MTKDYKAKLRDYFSRPSLEIKFFEEEREDVVSLTGVALSTYKSVMDSVGFFLDKDPFFTGKEVTSDLGTLIEKMKDFGDKRDNYLSEYYDDVYLKYPSLDDLAKERLTYSHRIFVSSNEIYHLLYWTLISPRGTSDEDGWIKFMGQFLKETPRPLDFDVLSLKLLGDDRAGV